MVIRSVSVHIFLWVIYFTLEFLANMFHYRPDDFDQLTIDILLYLPGMMVAVYWIYFGIIPTFLMTKRVPPLALKLTLVIILIYGSRYLIAAYYWNIGEEELLWLPWSKVLKNSIRDLASVALVACALFIRDWWKQETYLRSIERSNAENRLALMLQQLQPHFLFNTFNNIYSLIRKDTEKGLDALLKLSEVIEYIVHTDIGTRTELSKELSVVERFIELNRLKYGDQLKVTVSLESKGSLKIPPLLVLSLTENAFKHGGLKDDEFHIRIDGRIEKDQFVLTLDNSVLPAAGTGKHKGKGSAILEDLLQFHYADQWTLTTQLNNNRFSTQITMPAT